MATYEEKELIAATLNGLESYAKEIAQDAWEPLIKIRRIIKEMSSYWDMQEEKDWERSFDNHVLLSYFDQKAEPVPDEEKKRVIQLKAGQSIYRNGERGQPGAPAVAGI